MPLTVLLLVLGGLDSSGVAWYRIVLFVWCVKEGKTGMVLYGVEGTVGCSYGAADPVRFVWYDLVCSMQD